MADTTITRTLVLSVAAPPAQVAALAVAEGVLGVEASSDGKRLSITYDLRHTVLDALAKVAAGQGLLLSQGLCARMGRAWASFQDDNLRSQAKLEHHCCSTPPKR